MVYPTEAGRPDTPHDGGLGSQPARLPGKVRRQRGSSKITGGRKKDMTIPRAARIPLGSVPAPAINTDYCRDSSFT